MATEEQIPKLGGVLVEHQKCFKVLSTEDAQWVIQNPQEAIAVSCEAIKNRSKQVVASPSPIERVRVISEKEIHVNLDAPPKLPFNNAEIESQTGNGWVRIERRGNDLYKDGRKVILHLSKRQKGGKVIRGHELREELSEKPILHPNILDALMEHPHLIPEDWKKDENGNTRYIFFWAVIFRRADGDLYVRCFCWFGEQWHSSGRWLVNDWHADYPAALLASA